MMSNTEPTIFIAPDEVELSAIRSQGAGGQNVNKVATAIHLRFDVRASSLPAQVKERLLALDDRRINRDGVIVIKAQSHRTQDRNREDAFARLNALVADALRTEAPRVPSRPTRGSRQRRLETKKQRGQTKALRRPPRD